MTMCSANPYFLPKSGREREVRVGRRISVNSKMLSKFSPGRDASFLRDLIHFDLDNIYQGDQYWLKFGTFSNIVHDW